MNEILFENLDFQVNQGEQWAIVGESGSGKSALLQTIQGKFNVVAGEIRHHYFYDFVQNQPNNDPYFTYHSLIAEVSAKHNFRNLSHTTDFYYQQRYNSQDSEDAQTVEEYLSEIKPACLVPRPYWTYYRVLKQLKLEALSKKQLIKLSNGETKRLLIAAALLKGPMILLLDNPFSGLDVQTRLQFNAILHAITQSGITVIMVTTPREIPDVITHIAVLKEGKIIHKRPKSDFELDIIKPEEEKPIDFDKLKLLCKKETEKKFNTIVKIKDVSVRYGTNLILDKVNWHIKPGDRWALSGPNGSGKSTLLSLINGDNPQAYANDIILFDRKRGSGESIWDIKRKIGFVSPELYQYFPMENTCVQAIESGFYDTQGLFRKSIPENKETALQWMHFLGLEDDAGKFFKNVSASKQRLCLLGRALVKNPPLLILDEPCQGLDSVQQGYFRDIIDAICLRGDATLIYVTHYREELPRCIQEELALA